MDKSRRKPGGENRSADNSRYGRNIGRADRRQLDYRNIIVDFGRFPVDFDIGGRAAGSGSGRGII